MAYEKLSTKLDEYLARVKAGKASKIKPRDVEKVITKLRVRRAELLEAVEKSPVKAERLNHKLQIAEDLIARAEWLLGELRPAAPHKPPATEGPD